MSSPQNNDQRGSTDNTVAVENLPVPQFPVPAESELGGASSSPRGDLPRDKSRQDSGMQHPTAPTDPEEPRFSCVNGPLTDGNDVTLGHCSNCSSEASAFSAPETSSGLRQPSNGDHLPSVAQSSGVSARVEPPCPQSGPRGTTVAQQTVVQTGKTSGDADVTRSASMAPHPSNVGTPQTTLETLETGSSNTAGETSTLRPEEPNSGSPGTLTTTQADDGLSRASSPQPVRSADNLATSSQSSATDEQVRQQRLNSGVSTGRNHNDHVGPRHQQSPATTISRGSSSRVTDVELSAQQQARLGTSSAHRTHITNTSVASSTSPFGMPPSDLLLETLASQYAVEEGAFERSINPYADYFHTS